MHTHPTVDALPAHIQPALAALLAGAGANVGGHFTPVAGAVQLHRLGMFDVYTRVGMCVRMCVHVQGCNVQT